jgi:endoribonuclease Dicer
MADPLSRPRVLALMTPADRGFCFDSAMLKLEMTLDSKVCGICPNRREEILAFSDRPHQIVVLYGSPSQPTMTNLSRQLHHLDPSQTFCRSYFMASREVLVEVGVCASDLVWRDAIKEIDSNAALLSEGNEEVVPVSKAHVQRQISEVVKNWEFTMPNLDHSSQGFNVTHKFLKLVKILKSCESYGEAFRGIVFGM